MTESDYPDWKSLRLTGTTTTALDSESLIVSFLIQLLLPRNQDEEPFPAASFDQVRRELTEKFGGVTAYTRSTADGLWESDEGIVERDKVVLFEVMSDRLRPRWWRRYRVELERRFAQDEIVIRAQRMQRL